MAEDSAAKTNVIAITLHVVDDKGAAVPNVLVRLLEGDFDTGYWHNLNSDRQSDQNGTVVYKDLPDDKLYRLFVKSDDGRLAFRALILGDNVTYSESTLKLEPPTSTTVRVQDSNGHPLAGAELWTVSYTGNNGTVSLHRKSLESCGFSPTASNSQGELVLPPLPPGKIDVQIVHPDYASCQVTGIQVGSSADATFKPGATLELHIRTEPNEKLVDSLKLELSCDSSDAAASLYGPLPWLKGDGTAKLVVPTGEYGAFRLRHPDFIIVPIYHRDYGHFLADEGEPIRIPEGKTSLDFQLRRKITVRGRVIDHETGRPVPEAGIKGDLYTGAASGTFARFADEWASVDFAETNEKGEYELKLAAGRTRVTFSGKGLLATPSSVELNVAADSSTVGPDFVARPIPKIRGIVQDPAGQPVSNAVVRFRGTILAFEDQALTDAHGRFELAPPWIPQDFKTHQPLESQTIVAFDPFQPLDGEGQLKWNDPESFDNLVVKLEPHPFESTIGRCTDDLGKLNRGVPADQKDHLTSISLNGKPAPELDGVEWLNTNGKRQSLADFRGKYVLLQFWTTWCGPCHADMPSLRLVESLYRDKGLVVIGVHNNSMPVADVKKDAIENKLTYPIVIDHPDGRILAAYNAHGISGYPSYVLIGPDGNLLRDDATIPAPSLRGFKIETVREFILTNHDNELSRQFSSP